MSRAGMWRSPAAGALALALAGLGCRTGSPAPQPVASANADWAKRDVWQRPGEVMDALGIRPGSVVADVGAGEGYFTFHLAARVGPNGKVYAEDIQDSQLDHIRERAKKERIAQIEVVLGTASDPKLPAGALDAILVVRTYHEMEDHDAMLGGMVRALKPGGRLGIIEPEGEPNRPRSSYANEHSMSKALVLQDAADHKLRFVREPPRFEAPDRHEFFVIFEKPSH